jgi:gluconolactonase
MSDFEVHDPRFGGFFMGNAALERLAGGFRWAEGPVWFGDAGHLLFSDIPNNRIMRWSDAAGLSVSRQPSNYTNGHTRDREGRLVSCEHGGRCVSRTELDGTITVLVDRWQGKPLNSPNDVVVKSDGTIWFTDPHYGIMTDYEGDKAEQEIPCQVYRFDPGDGSLAVVCDDFACPNGICFSPDETRLYVAETAPMFAADAPRHIRVFDVVDGARLAGGEIFYVAEPGFADGMRVDTDGNLWTSAGDGVHCVSAAGELLGRIKVPEVVANVTFGGLKKNRLFICGTTSLYAVYLNRRGVQWP